MNKITVSIIGQDRPGILSAVTKILHENHCNLEDVNQTILQSVFGALFIVSMPDGMDEQTLKARLIAGLTDMHLHVFVKGFMGGEKVPPICEQYVITTLGPDQQGLVEAISTVLATYEVNITSLKAVFKGGENPIDNVMIFEVDVPRALDMQMLRDILEASAQRLALDINIQHRKVFEKMNRI